ncbi:MAG: hypothetical protein HYZ42_14640 [Bacteroidetes bacterium]|nr:hypothetical protein [Bacteroidota bacterium]
MCYNVLTGYTYTVWESLPKNIHPVVKNYAPGPTGAILIESTTGEIYSVSINGGQPVKFIKKPANNGLLSNPSWNRDGSKIMVSVNGIFGKYNVIFDHNGLPLDTIFNLTNGTFSNNSSLVTSIDNSGVVRQFNPDFDKTVRSYQTPFKNNTGLNVAISPNGFDMVVCDFDYIYQVNLIDSSTKPIRQICETKQYGMPSYSFKGDKILFTKECYRKLNKDTLAFSSSIHVMDKNCFHQDSIPLRTN